MFLMFSPRDIGGMILFIGALLFLAAFGQAILAIIGIALVCGVIFIGHCIWQGMKRDKAYQKEIEIRVSENTHKTSPENFVRRIMKKVEDDLRVELGGGAVIEHSGSVTGDQTCDEMFDIFYTDRADATDEDITRLQIVFTMNLTKPYGAGLQMWDLGIWPKPEHPIWSDREASIDAAATMIVRTMVDKVHPETSVAP